jgi:hypothetical protein
MSNALAFPRLETVLASLNMREFVLRSRLDRKRRQCAAVSEQEEEEWQRTHDLLVEGIDWTTVRVEEDWPDIHFALTRPYGEPRSDADTRVLDKLFRLDDSGETQELFKAMREEAPDVLEAAGLLDAAESSEQPSGESDGKGHAAAERGRGIGWQEVKDRLEDCRVKGERYTSREDFANRFECSKATVQKAIGKGSAELQQWASKQHSPSRLNMSPEAAAVALKKTPQTREPIPGDTVEDKDVEAMLQRLLEEANPDERARIHAMSFAEKRQLAETAYRDPDLEEQALKHKKRRKLRMQG